MDNQLRYPANPPSFRSAGWAQHSPVPSSVPVLKTVLKAVLLHQNRCGSAQHVSLLRNGREESKRVYVSTVLSLDTSLPHAQKKLRVTSEGEGTGEPNQLWQFSLLSDNICHSCHSLYFCFPGCVDGLRSQHQFHRFKVSQESWTKIYAKEREITGNISQWKNSLA